MAKNKKIKTNTEKKVTNVVESQTLGAIDAIVNSIPQQKTIIDNLQSFAPPTYTKGISEAVKAIHSQFPFTTSPLPNLSFSALHAVSANFGSNTIGASNFQALKGLDTLSNLIARNSHSFMNPSIYQNIASSSILQLGPINFTNFGIESDLLKAIQLSSLTGRTLDKFGIADIGKLINMPKKDRNTIEKASMGIFNGYSNLVESFSTNPKSFTELEPSISRIAPITVYNTSNFLESISILEEFDEEKFKVVEEIEYENEFSLSSHLPLLDKGLNNMWKGAVEALKSSNSDKNRHFIISIRELFTHVFHILAPNDDIKMWSTSEANYVDGKPTRKARLKYIMRDVSNKPIEKFFEKDYEATLAFIDILQQGTHSIESKFELNQLKAIKAKAETTLRFLLEIQFNINAKG